MIDVSTPAADCADLERRFGGLRRLYGDREYERIRAARIAVVGLGGVGSWAVEALARSGVAQLTLIDFDHVAESNINRQVQALGSTLGMAKGQALEQRVRDIHPGCRVHVVDAFVARTPLVTQASALHSPEYVYLVDGANGRVVHDDTVESYAQAVAEIFAQPGVLAAMQARCAQDALKYTLDAMADNFAAGVVACLRRAGHVIP